MARAASERFPRIEIRSRALFPAMLLVLSIGTFAFGVAYTLASHEGTHDVRMRAMHTQDNVEALQALLLHANAEFLLGLGSARATSYGWPVERVVEATRCFEQLQETLAHDRASLDLAAALRRDTARWVWQLSDTAVHASANRDHATVDSGRLLSTNRNLSHIVSRLAILRASQSEVLRADLERTANRLFIERAVLASTAAMAFGLLLYAFAARHRAQLARQRAHARLDALTALPNRVMLAELLGEAIRKNGAFALLFIDIDHFKDVNDSLGHGAGDALLCEAAVRLATATGPHDAVARYGGDEFVILIDCTKSDEALIMALERVKRAFDAPVMIDDVQLHVQTSIGVTRYPTDGADAESLLRNADLAMYRAKALGRNGVQHFRAELAHEAKRRIALSRRLREALESEAFELVYQPQIDTRSMTVTGVEALIRWCDAELGVVSPASFIPLAEELGLIVSIDEWVLNTACAQAKRWEDVLPGVRISINVSPRQLARRGFHRTVRQALDNAGLAPDRLEIEITERALIAQGALPTLRALSETGVSIAIDDFGSGYSSLSYLRSFHADRLKIDMSFVQGIGKSREDEAIIRAILALAHSLQFEVVAEGVETNDQLSFLLDARCDAIQGYIFAPPVSATDAPNRIADLERSTFGLVSLI